ncbi:P-loop containing nucleoside triphosphate hydrolase protein [Penicillium longicatenatum]|uniref:P-loop containing nucleoside triphosphate hydrolase protein n=1 Tax=Penicillium longicatenatum TaxID=1561947 RepID=UPI00254956C6|nr:P-loop containing nucleoside triphosphate hydrolase protein [Penicillium longicatenatum]KAJ5644222.1 P-loop containing nucleoside triphosphate hydrolase protein [Penicillium longicatenatum]
MSLLDVFFPGLSMVSASAQHLFAGNLDSTTRFLCTLGMFILFARYAICYAWEVVRKYFTSTIYVSYYDEAYDMLVDWIAEQPFVHNAHSLIARVRTTQRPGNIYSTKKKPVTFSPWDGSFLFWYRGHLLILHCAVKEHREDLRISSIGLNANILKALVEECREKYLRDTQQKISVFEHHEGEWKKARLRSVRPLSTVIMDERIKDDILRDVDEFLDQDMQAWYAERGIPYKRGYLLFGPPGTGKSSFSLSLAGKHKLDIYTLQLSNISDSTLMRLFAELPPHCIVLLEDVDTAGVGRRDSVDATQENESKSAVTLSGLLNVLDGVSSQEGRILIMTTNHIDHLDEALIRPGRSDKKIHFKLADQTISSQLFHTVFKQLPNQKQCNEVYDDETFSTLAQDFASKVPEQVFSPAEVLSFLLERKKSPSDAVSCVESWVANTKY